METSRAMLNEQLLRRSIRSRGLARLGLALSMLASPSLQSCSPSESGIDSRRARVESEVLRLGAGHAWAGTYYRGDGLGRNEHLSLAPNAGYQYANHGCLGLYGEEHGTVELADGKLVLHPGNLFPENGLGREFRIVDWGERRYLVEPGEMLSFVNKVNQLRFSEDEILGPLADRRFYLRTSDREKPRVGLPILPPEFARLLLAKRIEGHVTAVDGEQLEVDLGSADGAFEGMELELWGAAPHGFGTLTLRAVTEHSSRGSVEYLDSYSAKPALGWTACSSSGD